MDFKSLIPWRGKQVEESFPEVASPIARMRWEMDRVFNRAFSDLWWPFTAEEHGSGCLPSLDIRETDDEVLVRAEIPGVEPKELDLSIHGNVLTLAGSKSESSEQNQGNFFRSECRYGSFQRSVTLPSSVDPENVQADYNNGVLNIRLKKQPSEKPKRIPIQASST